MQVKHLWLFPLLGIAQIQLSQNPISGDCRISQESLKPIIPPFFPYLYQYEWDNTRKMETAWFSPHIRLRIEQRACTRHHITYELRLPPSYSFSTGFTRGILSLLDTVITLIHRENFAFLAVKRAIWDKLIQHAQMRSIGEVVMLPYQEWSFLLRLDSDQEGYVALLETIRYISSQAIQRPGIPDYMDDGWSP
ncbi:MAG: hypothetical protein RMJ66_04780 [Bacteroidia bacterium]|nr:hypothetical protein [Bacteroidia bacterium]MDW8134362.1 hypothetical protein [Bacteroidia bacterium]